ncbi:MAG: nicotinamide riboside transporter PnuC [Marinilabiliales bacterium]|nr:nicotinamide riboside transporter PnuC [Marinilabiliales bacterium]
MEGLKWLQENAIELCGTLTGFAYLICSIRQHKLTWPFGLLNALFYVAVFFTSRIYADMSLQIYYVGISLYGWWSWYHGGSSGSPLVVTQTSKTLWLKLVLVNGMLFLGIVWILHRFTDSQVPFWDGLTTSMSIVATWMLARKKLEHWLVWIITDALLIALFLFKGLYLTSLLYLVYTLMAFLGYREWKKELTLTVA